jgi:hypothetical protein
VSKDIKVTDKRIFTAEGALREEFRHLDETPHEEAGPATAANAPATPEAAEPRAERDLAPPPVAPAPAPEPESSPRLELPGTPPGLGAPTFYDLVAILAEPVAIYLGDTELPDGQSVENLEMARLHIDLLDVLRQKTAGHLSAQESAVLEDVLYRLRLRYVQKRG